MTNVGLATLLKLRGIRQSDLAAALGVDKSRVTRWSQNKVPAERVIDVERVTGISRHELRPDVYGPAASKEAAE